MINDFTKKEAPVLSTLGLGGGNASRLILSSGPVGLATTVATRSLRLSSAYLTRTPSSEGDRKTWTWSGWVKRSGIESNQRIFQARDANTGNQTFIQFRTDDKLYVGGNSDVFLVNTDNVFRDLHAWGNLTIRFDTTQSTAANRIRIYWNGVQQDLSGTQPTQDYATAQINSTLVHRIGNDSGGGSEYYDGYLSDVYLLDGTSVSPVDNFIELDSNGVYQSKLYNGGSYGTNGFHLNFDDATSTTTISADQSGKGNDYTTNSISVSAGADNDSLFDVPNNKSQTESGAGGQLSGNYATWSKLVQQKSTGTTISDGGLKTTCSGTRSTTMSTFPLKGKTYWEVTFGSGTYNYIGMTQADGFNTQANQNSGIKYTGYKDYSYGWQQTDGKLYKNSNILATPGTYSNGDVLGWAYDADNNILKLYKNGSLVHTENSIENAQYYPAITHSESATSTTNFGQRAFEHTAPSGYKPVCTALLPTPTIADGSDHFDTSLWTVPSGSANTTISGLSFAPDLLITKNRSQSYEGSVYDTVRGDDKYLKLLSNSATSTESTAATRVNLTSDGFVLEADNDNSNYGAGSNSVGWVWNAGTSTVSNTDGDITTSLRVNTTAKFSIATYSGSGTNGDTIGHGLGVEPDFCIIKARNKTDDWRVYHSALGTGKTPALNSNNAASSGANWQSVSSTTLGLQNDSAINSSSYNYLALFFAAVEGYSAFGSYTGNGSSDGTFVETGFRPALVLQKRSDGSGDWTIHDSKREPGNDVGLYLITNASTAEQDGNRRDFLSNGFKLRTSSAGVNADGGTYFWAAFAENPFQANGGLAY
jgi:hypothetical protein